jgi:hypothetical protein
MLRTELPNLEINPKAAQEIRFLGKIGFLKPCPRRPRNFLEKSDFSNRVPKRAQEMKNKSAAQEIRCPRNPIFWT